MSTRRISTVYYPGPRARSIPYAEVPKESPHFSFTGNVMRLTRVFNVDWRDRFDFCKAMLGFPVAVRNVYGGGAQLVNLPAGQSVLPTPAQQSLGGVRYISRYLPTPYLDLTSPSGRSVLYPTQVGSLEGLGARGDPANNQPRVDDPHLYRDAKVTILYDTPTYTFEANGPITRVTSYNGVSQPDESTLKRFVTKLIHPSAQVLHLPRSYYKWAEAIIGADGRTIPAGGGAGDPVNGTYVKLQSHNEVTYIWHQVPAMTRSPFDTGTQGDVEETEMVGAVFTHLACVNDNFFDGFAPGTLLLVGVEARPYRWITGQRLFDYIYRMRHFHPFADAGRVAAAPSPGLLGIAQQTGILPANVAGDRFVGHNHFLRYVNVSTNQPEPTYCLITHDGGAPRPPLGNGSSRTVFGWRNFDELFSLASRDQLISKYSVPF